MIRKLKALGVLSAVVALSAVTASAAHANFKASSYPATIGGTSAAEKITAFGSSIECTENTFSATLAAESARLKVTPAYKKCTAFGLPATVNFTTCYWEFEKPNHANPIVDVLCSTAGDAIDITVYSGVSHATALCHIRIPSQLGKGGGTIVMTNVHPNVVVSGSISGLTATEHRTSVLCPGGPSTNAHTASAVYGIQPGGITFSGGTISVT